MYEIQNEIQRVDEWIDGEAGATREVRPHAQLFTPSAHARLVRLTPSVHAHCSRPVFSPFAGTPHVCPRLIIPPFLGHITGIREGARADRDCHGRPHPEHICARGGEPIDGT